MIDVLFSIEQFLANLNLMDYSLLLGIHDCDRADPLPTQDPFDSEENGVDDDEEEENLNNAAATAAGPTPPDSPMAPVERPVFVGELDPRLEAFATRSSDRKRPMYHCLPFTYIYAFQLLSCYGSNDIFIKCN